MGQTTLVLSGSSIVPMYNGQNTPLTGQWAGSAIGNGYTLLTLAGGGGAAITKLVIGQGTNDLQFPSPTYNDVLTLGGQSTPVTPWLSPAQDDSWAPRYQVSPAVYQETTQVPSQSLPLMTHIYSIGAHLGIWRIAYVIDDNKFVVYDPQIVADGVTFDNEELVPICQNMYPATKVQFIASTNLDTLNIYNIDGISSNNIAGPFNIEINPNQEGIVEPFVVAASGSVMAIVTY